MQALMVSPAKYNPLLWALLVIGAMTFVRIGYAQSFLLVPDETNYWQWSRYLDWGYHDQTPMIGWAIHLFSRLLGHTELAVRLPSIVSTAIGSTYLVLIANRWFSPGIALQTALLTQSIFIFNVGGILATADGLLGAAWAAAAYHTARGFEDHQWRQWSMGGLWFGMGMLSKYTMVLFLPFVLFFGLVTPIGRRRMGTIRPYVGCAIGLVMFAPVVAWNAANNWNSVRHVAYLGGANEPFALHWKFLGEHLAAQVGLLTPMVFGLVCASWIWVMRRWRKLPHWIYAFLFLTSFPIFGGFTLLSLHTRVYGNWPCFGYLTASVLAAAIWSYFTQDSGSGHGNTRVVWRWCVGSSYALTILVFTHVIWPILPIPLNLDRTVSETLGWDTLGLEAARTRDAMPRVTQTFLFGLNYQTASELAFYAPGNPYTVSINRWNRPNVYDYWWTDAELLGKDAVGVLGDGSSQERLLQIFQRVESPQRLQVFARPRWGNRENSQVPVKTWYIYRCFDFQGGLRWIPGKGADVRGG
jgi:4-amino-4-deoxy-L-arabinose transferase-like glycosyltransferase